MLYQVGAVTMDTHPFNADSVSRAGEGSTVAKPVMGRLDPRERTGEGAETLTISGKLLPIKIGGLTEIEMLDAYRRDGTPVPVLRGDGKVLGNYVIDGLREQHSNLTRNGVGFVVQYTLTLGKTGQQATSSLVQQLVAFFQ